MRKKKLKFVEKADNLFTKSVVYDFSQLLKIIVLLALEGHWLTFFLF